MLFFTPTQFTERKCITQQLLLLQISLLLKSPQCQKLRINVLAKKLEVANLMTKKKKKSTEIHSKDNNCCYLPENYFSFGLLQAVQHVFLSPFQTQTQPKEFEHLCSLPRMCTTTLGNLLKNDHLIILQYYLWEFSNTPTHDSQR